MSKKYPHVYIDVAIGARPVGRMVFELFTDLTPRTAENFRGLCTGEYGNVGLSAATKKLHYLDSKFHRIIDEFMVQGGDITHGDGSGGHSIYGPIFEDENFQRRHACAGLLSMANRGRNTNSSQFFITLNPCPHLDGKHVVFGQIIHGMDVVRRIAKTPIDANKRPKLQVLITDCGEVGDTKDFLRFDPFKQEELVRLKEINRKNVLSFEERPEPAPEQPEELPRAELTPEEARSLKYKLLEDEIELQAQEELERIKRIPEDKYKKLRELKERMKQANKDNLKAVALEENLSTNPAAVRQLKDQKRQEYRLQQEEDLKFKGIVEKEYLNKPAIADATGKRQANQVFGWDVFNEDTLYRAYSKRCKNLPFYKEDYEMQKAHPDLEVEPSADKLQKLVEDITQQKEDRKNFSRRKTFDVEEEVTYINERNRIYNKKLERHFKAHAAEIKANLERGTALHN